LAGRTVKRIPSRGRSGPRRTVRSTGHRNRQPRVGIDIFDIASRTQINADGFVLAQNRPQQLGSSRLIRGTFRWKQTKNHRHCLQQQLLTLGSSVFDLAKTDALGRCWQDESARSAQTRSVLILDAAKQYCLLLDAHRRPWSPAFMGHFFNSFVRRRLLSLVRAGQRFFTPALCIASTLANANCALTIDDLKWGNERATVDVICDTPTEIPDDVKMFAVIWSTGTIFTDEDEQKLRYYSAYADAFFLVDRNAPKWTAQLMPPEYGLNCTNRYSILPEATEVLPLYCPAPTLAETLAKTMVRPDGNYLGQASEVKTRCQPVRIPVCARPKTVPEGVTQWAKWDKKGHLIINNDKAFADAAANADIIFVLDDKAPAESVYWFVKDPKELSCPGKPPPMPYKEANESGKLAMMTAATQMAGLMYGPPKTGNGKDGSSATTSTAANGSKSSTSPSSGGSPSDTSSPDGKGPPLDFLDRISRGISITGALVQGDTSGNLKDPNGSRYGIPNGKNPGGPNLWVLQVGVSVFAIVQNPIKTSKDFVDLIRRGLAKGEAIIISNPKHFTKELAEKLAATPEQKLTQQNLDMAESFGESMAPSLNLSRTVMPYSRAQVFTAKWGGDYQAHHIFEQQMMKDLKYVPDDITNSPAIILTKKEHELITAKLNDARNKLLQDLAKVNRKVPNKAELWNMYQKVYKDNPTWLEAIKGYF
jgi:hypothetical protein